jgi:hypothetical protein
MGEWQDAETAFATPRRRTAERRRAVQRCSGNHGTARGAIRQNWNLMAFELTAQTVTESVSITRGQQRLVPTDSPMPSPRERITARP